MPKAMRSAQQIDAVREQILECAFDILVKNGFESLSMSKIGAEMKMTAANIYNYYANKDELIIAIHKKAFKMLYDIIDVAVGEAQTPLDRFRKMIEAYVAFAVKNINIYDIMLNRPVLQYSDYIGTPQEAVAREEFQNSVKVLLFAVKVIGEYRASRPDLPAVDTRLLALECFSSLHGVISLYNSGMFREITEDPEKDFNTLIKNAVRCIIN